jgi:hypothetical protein
VAQTERLESTLLLAAVAVAPAHLKRLALVALVAVFVVAAVVVPL